jgi:phage head maturation protease
MSFAFRVTRQQWSPDYDQRDILEVDLHRGDVSVVNFGANPATSVGAVRAADFDRLEEADAKALYERLQRRFQPAEAEPQTLSLFQAQAALLGL